MKSYPARENNVVVNSQLTTIVHQHISAGIFATLFNSSIVLYALWDTIDRYVLISWYVFAISVNLARLLEVYLYKRAKPSADESASWARWFTLGAIFAGISWGLAAAFLLSPESIIHQTIIVMLIAGTVAGATATLSPLPYAFLPFVFFSLLPLTINLIFLGTEIHYLIAILSIVFAIFMYSAGKVHYLNLLNSLTLSYENNQLLSNLETEKQQATNLNKTLKIEISQRIDAELQLKKKERSLEEVQSIARMGSWETDITNQNIELSNVMKSLFDIPPGQDRLSHRALLDKIIPADRAQVELARNNAMKHLHSYNIEYQMSTGNDKLRIFEEQGVPRIDKQGQCSGLSAIVLDITHRKEMDKLKNEFISTVSHELRTPLTSISGTLSLLESNIITELPEKAHHLVSVAHRNALRLTHLVNDILDIDKLGFGGLPLEFKHIDLLTIIKDSIEENIGYAKNLHVKIHLSDIAEPAFVYADAEKLNQVLTNLLSNAAKYSPGGEVVEVRLVQKMKKVRVEVCDHGPGIDKSFHDKVFQKFSQGDTSDSRFQYGSGLGLSIAKLIVEKHHGEIGFDSELGKGSCFWFELPLAD